MPTFYAALALMIGLLLPFQAGVNAKLRIYVGHPLQAALISFAVGTAALLITIVASGTPWPTGSRLAEAPWWAWVGGLLGANYVALAVILAPRLGAAALIGLTVTGQMIASLALDHLGSAGYTAHPINTPRVVGTVLLLAGVYLIQRF